MKYEDFLDIQNIDDMESYIISMTVQLSQIKTMMEIQQVAESGGFLPEAQNYFCHAILLNAEALLHSIQKQIMDVYDRIDCNQFEKFLQSKGIKETINEQGKDDNINESKSNIN